MTIWRCGGIFPWSSAGANISCRKWRREERVGMTSDGEGSCGEWAERAADPSRHGLHDVADFQAGPHPFCHTTTDPPPPPAIIMLD